MEWTSVQAGLWLSFLQLLNSLLRTSSNIADMSAAGPRHGQGGGVGGAERGRHLREGVAGGARGPAQARQ